MNTPSFGTLCADCGAPANLYAGQDPLCWDCDSGPLTRKTKVNTPPRMQPQIALPMQRDTQPQTIRSGDGARGRISDQTRAAILAEDPTISCLKLAKKYGVSKITIFNIRKKASGLATL